MQILVIGGGGREHALVWKIARSPMVDRIYCAPGNAGTAHIAENVDIAPHEVDRLVRFATERRIGLTVAGPEQPLVLGIADKFHAAGLRIFGPTAAAARIEGSKVFSKTLMDRSGVPTAPFEVFDSAASARAYLRDKDRIIVKADGLAAGKGAFVCHNRDQALMAVQTLMEDRAFGPAGDRIVIEEFLDGPEVSFLALSDGKTILPLPPAQDHKAAFDNDEGPNTGGMGAYSPAPLLTPQLEEQVMQEIMYPVVEAMARENCPYRGVLYAGLMITADGPYVLEFNARFGDPETQPLMTRLSGDIVPLLEACADGDLAGFRMEWSEQSSVCVVMAAAGYPGSYEKGKVITGLEEASGLPGVEVFHAGTRLDGNRVVTNGGRVLGVTALGGDLSSAIQRAYEAVDKISWDGIHYRKDIGRGGRARPGANGERFQQNKG